MAGPEPTGAPPSSAEDRGQDADVAAPPSDDKPQYGEVAWCPVHGERTQDGWAHGVCNQTVRKEGGVPILCGQRVYSNEQAAAAAKRQSGLCPVHGLRGPGGQYLIGGERHCNVIVGHGNGVPVPCHRLLATGTAAELRAAAAEAREQADAAPGPLAAAPHRAMARTADGIADQAEGDVLREASAGTCWLCHAAPDAPHANDCVLGILEGNRHPAKAAGTAEAERELATARVELDAALTALRLESTEAIADDIEAKTQRALGAVALANGPHVGRSPEWVLGVLIAYSVDGRDKPPLETLVGKARLAALAALEGEEKHG